MKRTLVKTCRLVCAGVLALAISTAFLPCAMAAGVSASTEMEAFGEERAEALAESISEAVFETFTDETLVTPYEYVPYGDLTVLSGCSAEELEALLKDSGLEGLGSCYAEKEQTHGINALFLISVAQLESGFGKSKLAQNCNNLGGIKNGNNGYMEFPTKQDCVDYQATLLRDDYLDENGKYFEGKTTKDVSQSYCGGSESWYTQVESLMRTNFEKIMEMREAS
ncbi:glucosaminidase domain-containing protein [Christensenella tenuis]|uniref:Glucosaminidase domain-containing protein n=1 Tax=Christensenella tenuis TaxID=2763033 RepID=A0ABR7EC98_9FIRM|nr:glucosaminidase domain-containing protein [Christensenella tenuis]MBC5647397.1 glucosaminidase domain-containing protein [Christensenella tenuis]